MSDKEPDILDQAAAITDFMIEQAVAQQRQFAAPETHPEFDGKHCVEDHCGAEIPKERLDLKKVRCVDCQLLVEKGRGQRRGRWS